MRVIRNEKFTPRLNTNSEVISYCSTLEVEVSSQLFQAVRAMSVEEYESTYPALRDFIHDSLRTDIMTQIRKKLFEGVV